MHHQNKQENLYPMIYSIYGVYKDWQIDNNLIFDFVNEPNGIRCFEDFLECKWKVVEVHFNSKRMLSIDLELPQFQLLKTLKIDVVSVLEDSLSGKEVLNRLIKCENELHMQLFDIVSYYMNNAPWNLKTSLFDGYTTDKETFDIIIFDKRIIVKVMTKEGLERITSVNDTMHGKVEEYEYLVDPIQYDDATSHEKERYWSSKLGIPVLCKDEEIDFDYIYSTDK